MAVPRIDADFVPPAQAHETSPRDVFEVVKVHGEKHDGDDEDQDVVVGEEEAEEVDEEVCCAVLVGLEMGKGASVQRRKPRKVISVMGWEDRRQLSEPGSGLSRLLIGMFGSGMWLRGFGLGNALLLTDRQGGEVAVSEQVFVSPI